jgi:hypothetical protein
LVAGIVGVQCASPHSPEPGLLQCVPGSKVQLLNCDDHHCEVLESLPKLNGESIYYLRAEPSADHGRVTDEIVDASSLLRSILGKPNCP